MGRSVKVNGQFFPEISNYVPNAYIEDPYKIISSSLRFISKTRFCQGKNFDKTCSDGVIDFDYNLLNFDKFSFTPKLTIQSLTSRGTDFAAGKSLGFKAALKISEKWSFSVGGKNIVHFDETSDLGRNFI